MFTSGHKSHKVKHYRRIFKTRATHTRTKAYPGTHATPKRGQTRTQTETHRHKNEDSHTRNMPPDTPQTRKIPSRCSKGTKICSKGTKTCSKGTKICWKGKLFDPLNIAHLHNQLTLNTLHKTTMFEGQKSQPFEHIFPPFEHVSLPFEHKIQPFEHLFAPFEHNIAPHEHNTGN